MSSVLCGDIFVASDVIALDNFFLIEGLAFVFTNFVLELALPFNSVAEVKSVLSVLVLLVLLGRVFTFGCLLRTDSGVEKLCGSVDRPDT